MSKEKNKNENEGHIDGYRLGSIHADRYVWVRGSVSLQYRQLISDPRPASPPSSARCSFPSAVELLPGLPSSTGGWRYIRSTLFPRLNGDGAQVTNAS
jgi:hypothetical protein